MARNRGQSALSLWPLFFGLAVFGAAAAVVELDLNGGPEVIAAANRWDT